MIHSDKILISSYRSPCGDLLLGSYRERLCLCNWSVEKHPGRVDGRLMRLLGADYKEAETDIAKEASRQLDEYFRRERRVFDIPLLLAGTPFQKAVWEALMAIPYGHTLSYRQLAASLGMPRAMRAVANANGANAISIIIPCHRVVGANGALGGYGGGLDAKRFLLGLEQTG